MRTVVTLDSLDPDTSSIAAHVSTVFNQSDLLFDPSVTKQIPELVCSGRLLSASQCSVYFQQPRLADLSPIFAISGLRLINQQSLPPPAFDSVRSDLLNSKPSDINSTLSVIGDPRLYPFDDYLVIFQIAGGAFLKYRNAIGTVDSTYEVLPHFPGMVVREISRPEFESYDGKWGAEFDRTLCGGKPWQKHQYDPQFWMNQGVALSVRRPLFLQVLACVFASIALLSVILVYLLSEPSTYFINSLATIAALWDVRTILTGGAPKTPNIIDFSFLILFVVQFTLMALRFFFQRWRDIN
ncbi:hypothetical protein JAO29_16820 [Edaphobacter sp. HDX4]